MTELRPDLPAPLTPLRGLARNLRWAWHAPTRALFERLDPSLWEATRHNPVRLLWEAAPARLAALAADETYLQSINAAAADLEAYLRDENTWFRRAHPQSAARIAYFSAEFGVAECLRIYSGGLGVLAGDHLKSASDLGVPLVGVGLMYREGYFTQRVDAVGVQHDMYDRADFERLPITLESGPDGQPIIVDLPFLDHRIQARIWRADVGRVPLYLLDTDLDANRAEDRGVTDRLYGGDTEHRLRQEYVLGIGGMRALRLVGREADVVHLNEGHAAFAAMEHVREIVEQEQSSFAEAVERAKRNVVFTTHTPVPAGHDYFPRDLLERYLGGYVWEMKQPWDEFLSLGLFEGESRFCMTALALRLSSRRNGVSRLHGAVSREMWNVIWPEAPLENVPITHITNGVHLPTWVAPDVEALYSRYVGEHWSDATDEMQWHRANHIPPADLWAARTRQRGRLVNDVRLALAAQVARRGGDPAWTAGALDPDALTIVFARRFATYKRAVLLLSQEERLQRLLTGNRKVQFVFAGKAHPRDEPGKAMLQRIHQFAGRPELRGQFVFLEGYDLAIARTLVQGADVWLNVPVRPYEASGTSGMKAMANGALNLSIPDGWWAEAWAEHNRLNEPVGWSIAPADGPSEAELPEHGPGMTPHDREMLDRRDADALFDLLENEVVPLFYDRDADGLPAAWLERVRSAIRQLVPFFNTHRMVAEYVDTAYLTAPSGEMAVPGRKTAG
ncbi:MAG TPA: alpha-glucan family phosphorylase [Longimicrobiales bacterium]|nr:alpha-glucan family phosphorylase [Longimicrobiales bacterium]